MVTTNTEPILLEFPESFESDRLIIRAPLSGDGKAINEAMKESIEELRPWLPWAQSVPTIEQSEANIRQARLQFLERSNMRLHLVHKQTGQLVGSSGLHRIDWQVRKFEIGYWIRSSFQGQGFMTEAVKAITNFAITELEANRVEIRCDSHNLRSAKVAQRAGFTLEATLRNDTCDIDGSLRSTMIFSKVRGFEYE